MEVSHSDKSQKKDFWQNHFSLHLEVYVLSKALLSLWIEHLQVSSSLFETLKVFPSLDHSVQGIIMHDIAKIFHCNEQQKRLAKRDFLGHPIELKRDSLLQLLTKYFRWQNQYCVGHLRLACSMKCEESGENKCQLFDCDFEHSSYFHRPKERFKILIWSIFKGRVLWCFISHDTHTQNNTCFWPNTL